MTKKQMMEDPNSCWNKAKDNEPVFVLVGDDMLAGDTVKYWARKAHENGVNHKKVQGAVDDAKQFDEWPDKKLPN